MPFPSVINFQHLFQGFVLFHGWILSYLTHPRFSQLVSFFISIGFPFSIFLPPLPRAFAFAINFPIRRCSRLDSVGFSRFRVRVLCLLINGGLLHANWVDDFRAQLKCLFHYVAVRNGHLPFSIFLRNEASNFSFFF